MEVARDQDDASLVRAAQAGDSDAFAELFRRHHATVRRVCGRRLLNGGDADDVAQAAFVRAYERIDQCTGDRRFGAWVQVIALRLCGDAWRAGARTTPVADPVPDSTSGSDSCGDALVRKERAAAVRSALATLPARQRQVIVARYVEGRRPGDVAASLTLSVGAVDSLLLRARRRLALACQVAGVEHGAATAPVTTVTVAGGSAAASAAHWRPLLRPFARLGDTFAGFVEAVHSTVAAGPVLGAAGPTAAQRAAGLVGAGALLLSPLVPMNGGPSAPAPGNATGSVAGVPAPGRGQASAGAGEGEGGGLAALAVPVVGLRGIALPSASLPAVAVPAVSLPAVSLTAVAPDDDPIPPVPLPAVTVPAPAEAPTVAVAQVLTTVVGPGADVSVISTVDRLAGALVDLVGGGSSTASTDR